MAKPLPAHMSNEKPVISSTASRVPFLATLGLPKQFPPVARHFCRYRLRFRSSQHNI